MSQRAALHNLEDYWHGILDKLGLNVVVVQFDTHIKSPIHSHPDLEAALGLELQQVGAGFYDSTFYVPGGQSKWCFFHCRDLAKAMHRLKEQLAARNLLGICNILHAEESHKLCIWYSSDPDSVGRLIEG